MERPWWPQVKELKVLLFTNEGKMECEIDELVGGVAVPMCRGEEEAKRAPTLDCGH